MRRSPADHVSPEGSVRGIEVQNLMFVEGCFQEKGIAGFDHFFIQGTVAVARAIRASCMVIVLPR